MATFPPSDDWRSTGRCSQPPPHQSVLGVSCVLLVADERQEVDAAKINDHE
ncbi:MULTISPECIES: hypothetical protein [Streptomyces]|uniref:Uncharacterized protein n=1 Tax=Streptomyces anthocyanicus TaxID=68174 RepID=A0ABZ1M700_9ACTN|nr:MULTISPECIES: hypothetical protein [Streptomyces]MDX2927801.1 hypothetical protein [Streptomyces sp. NRRL_B-16638]MDX3408906.1 hypothetical protein [Streptomyces sp. ME02-6977A]MYU46433.1 hypothetical protein [Streptomyces sp. SID7813]NSL84410.1 hypothetical protein [Streptomyces coelicolor]QKN70199.1 hypothetical protein HCU77_34855 [Streptomyces coelicolor]